MAVTRSFTLPPKLSNTIRASQPTPDEGAPDGIDTLFVHPSVNIIQFTTSSIGGSSSSAVHGSRGMPWVTPTERTVAAGPMEIYRVPGSVSFLHSGRLLHAILPRGQCWCVDGVSKFAIRVMPDTYYRVELPGETAEELGLVEELKKVLDKVMHYERTACPFARGFSDELPELEDVRLRKVKRKSGKAKRWKMDRANSWKPEDGEEPPRQQIIDDISEESSDDDDEEQDVVEDLNETPERPDRHEQRAVMPPHLLKPRAAMRSITAPPQLSLRTTPPSRISAVSESADTGETARLETARLKTFQPILTDMPPSPPDSSAGHEVREGQDSCALLPGKQEKADPSEPTEEEIVRQQPGASPEEPPEAPVEALLDPPPKIARYDEKSLPKSLAAIELSNPEQDPDEADEPATPTKAAAPAQYGLAQRGSNPEDPFAAIQARILARRSIGGTTSFHPSNTGRSTSSSTTSSSTATISSTRSHASQLAQQHNLASALVRKAYAAFLGPPAHLVKIMLRIAARFANGTFGSVFFVESPVGASRRVPGSFHVSEEPDSDDEGELDEWDEDDFGVPLRSPQRLAAVRSMRQRGMGRGWELD